MSRKISDELNRAFKDVSKGWNALDLHGNSSALFELNKRSREVLVSKLESDFGVPNKVVLKLIRDVSKPWNKLIEELSAESLLAMWEQK